MSSSFDVETCVPYALDDPVWPEVLADQGYVAVAALTAEEARAAHEALWKWITDRFPRVVRGRPETYTLENYPDNVHGILKSYGAGQAEFLWRLRTHPAVLSAFAQIWKEPTSELITSFDGFCIYPAGFGARAGSWPHRDQDPNVNSRLCIQGQVVLSAPDDGVLQYSKVKGHWYKIPNEHPLPNGTLLKAPPGTLILWDSCVVHQNTPGSGRVDRSTAFVCMVPRSFASAATLRKRQSYFLAGRTTSHWPHQVKVNPDAVSFRSKYKTQPKDVMANFKQTLAGDKTVRRLVGFEKSFILVGL
ncbi:hypothetical protein DFJ74DRAFT_758361 [Hyaloraphidium curvatum]|nr:hypothetical protein DFJ74DRAFT_758361 [Hyaloraphidium curvatum]